MFPAYFTIMSRALSILLVLKAICFLWNASNSINELDPLINIVWNFCIIQNTQVNQSNLLKYKSDITPQA